MGSSLTPQQIQKLLAFEKSYVSSQAAGFLSIGLFTLLSMCFVLLCDRSSHSMSLQSMNTSSHSKMKYERRSCAFILGDHEIPSLEEKLLERPFFHLSWPIFLRKSVLYPFWTFLIFHPVESLLLAFDCQVLTRARLNCFPYIPDARSSTACHYFVCENNCGVGNKANDLLKCSVYVPEPYR